MTTIHDPIFDIPPRPMFRWGASPFHMRGGIYRETLAYSEALLVGRGLQLADVLRDHGDPSFTSFLSQRFNATDWYDIAPAIHFAPLVARASRISLAQHMRDSAKLHAERALGGFTSVLLKLLSNEAVAAWLPRISAWYHDFGGIETKRSGDRLVRGVRTGVPVYVVQSWAILGMHFTENVLARAGARQPRAHVLEALPDGTQFGCPLYRVTFEIRWEA